MNQWIRAQRSCPMDTAQIFIFGHEHDLFMFDFDEFATVKVFSLQPTSIKCPCKYQRWLQSWPWQTSSVIEVSYPILHVLSLTLRSMMGFVLSWLHLAGLSHLSPWPLQLIIYQMVPPITTIHCPRNQRL